jgi:hypothetical protein
MILLETTSSLGVNLKIVLFRSSDQKEKMMSQSIRVFWPATNGTSPFNFNWPPINANSVVLVTASEYDPAAMPDADGSARRFVGDATIRVNNIAPHGPPSDPNNGVTFMLEVDFGQALKVCTDITVLDDAPQVFFVEGAASPAH